MKPDRNLDQHVADAPVATDPTRDREILCRLLQAQQTARASRPAAHHAFSLGPVLRRPGSALAALASVAILVAIAFFAIGPTTSTLWAIEEAISALRPFRAVHFVARTPGGSIDIWSRANAAGTQSAETIVRAPGGAVAWTAAGRTHHYDPTTDTIQTEPVVTIGVEPWIGPAFLETLARTPGTRLEHHRAWFGGRDAVTLTGGLNTSKGPQSWVITFDAETRLPIRLKTWANLDRSGRPAFSVDEISFHEELPPGLFDQPVGATTQRSVRPLTVPNENIGLLSDPNDGLPVDGLGHQQAADRILRELVRALVGEDMARLRQLAPLTRVWGDDFLRSTLVSPENPHARIVRVVEIGPIIQSGHSSIGPLVAVPFVTMRGDETRVRVHMIVQFRDLGEKPSCVIVGPYGLTEDLD